MLNESLGRDLPRWRQELKQVCRELELLQGQAHAQTSFASLYASYEGPDGVRGRARAAVEAISGQVSDEMIAKAILAARLLLEKPLTQDDVPLLFADLRNALAMLLGSLPQESA